jgi:hypothetical protein
MNLANYPLLLFLLSFFGLTLSAWLGALYRKKRRQQEHDAREYFGLVIGATLTLLGLIIGFTFSMALTRYDQRKNYEEAEANAIGTEFLRADLLPAADAAKVRTLLLSYVDQRILFYTTRDEHQLRRIDGQTAKLQAELWSAVRVPVLAEPTAVAALAASGMNDVLNSQGYTQAAWWNRIPGAAWGLLRPSPSAPMYWLVLKRKTSLGNINSTGFCPLSFPSHSFSLLISMLHATASSGWFRKIS